VSSKGFGCKKKKDGISIQEPYLHLRPFIKKLTPPILLLQQSALSHSLLKILYLLFVFIF